MRRCKIKTLYNRCLGGIEKFSCLIVFVLVLFLANQSEAFVFQEKVSTAKSLSHYVMGQMYDLLGLTERAILEYEKAVQFDETSYLIRLRLGTNYARLGMLIEATDELRLVSQLNPGEMQSHYLLALIYSNQKEYEKAAGEYEIILKTFSIAEPQNIEIYSYLGQLYYSQRKYDQAIKQFENILELEPANADVMYLLGSLYLEAKYEQKAIDILKKSIQIDPQHEGCLNSLAYVYAEMGKSLDEAHDLIYRALKISPNNGAYLDTLGWIFYKEGKHQKALEVLMQADEVMKDLVIYEHLGDVNYALNRIDDALKYWELSLEILPDQEKILQKINKIKNAQVSKTK